MTQFLLETTEKLTVRSYSEGEIIIALSGNNPAENGIQNTQCMTSSFIMTPSQIIPDWNYDSVCDLSSDSFQAIIAEQPELVILGTGAKLSFPEHQALSSLHQAGIGVEVMNTSSACRTFNVLASENRYVVAGFLMI